METLQMVRIAVWVWLGWMLFSALRNFIRAWQGARQRREVFEAHGWKYQDLSHAPWKLGRGAQTILYRIEHEDEGLNWRLEAVMDMMGNHAIETRWSAPLGWAAETGVSAASWSQKLVDNPLASGAVRWWLRREMKKQAGLDGNSEDDLTEALLRISQTYRSARPLRLPYLRGFCIFNSLWREDTAREVFDTQFERDLEQFLGKLLPDWRKTFRCHLGKTQLLLRVRAELPAPLAIEMTRLGLEIAARARRFCDDESVFDESPLRRYARHLTPAQQRELWGATTSERLKMWGEPLRVSPD